MCRRTAIALYTASRSGRGTARPSHANTRHAPPRYVSTESAASERMSVRDTVPPAGSNQTTEFAFATEGNCAATCDPKSPCNGAMRSR